MTEPTEPKPTVAEALSNVMGDVQVIEKTSRNTQQGFWFRGIDDVMVEVGPVLRKHRVLLIPKGLSLRTERYRSNGNTGMKCAEVHMEYTAYGPAGDQLTGSAYGEAADAGDKSVSKAQSVALRVFLLQGLSIPTRQADPDASSHQRAPDDAAAKAALDDMTELFRWRTGDVDKDELDRLHADAVNQFAADNNGLDIRDCLDPEPIKALTQIYRERWDAAPAYS